MTEEKEDCSFYLYISIFMSISILVIIVSNLLKKRRSLDKKHVVVTGGSSGIGKCAAIEAAKLGAHVTLVARDEKRLEAARQEVVKACKSFDQKITCLSLDVTGDYETIEKKLLELEDIIAPVFMLVNCAGAAVCGRLEDTDPADIKAQLSLNLLGTIYPTKALIPRLKSRRDGVVVVTGSGASLLGIYGLSVYSSTKFALRGFAESLCMEASPYSVSVTLAVPPDTDTPGFANEEKSKPLETRRICRSAGLKSPDVVGRQIIKDALDGKFFSFVGAKGGLMCSICAGMAPESSSVLLTLQVMFLGIMRVIGLMYLNYFNYVVRKCRREQESSKKAA